jgi:HlyD family secretion protein
MEAQSPRSTRNRLRNGIITGMVLLAAASASAVLYVRSHRKTGPSFETVAVERGRLVARVTATGTLSAIVTVQVGSQVSGRIQSISVDFNSPVEKGQVIAKIDPALFQAAVEQARANYTASVGNLAKAKVQAIDSGRKYERAKQLADRKLIAQQDLDSAQADADAARAAAEAAEGQVGQNRAALHQAEVNLNYTTIISPIHGTVISRNVDVGQTVAASLQAPTLFTIAEDLRKMQVDTSVAEADVGKLNPGLASTFTVDAYPTERFRGVIRQIRNAPQTVQNVVTYDAVIDVKNDDLKLKPGMTANVTFVYAQKDDVLRVPNAAMRFRPPPELGLGGGAVRRGPGGAPPAVGAGGPRGGGRPGGPDAAPERRTVWVLREMLPVAVSIKPGVSDGTQTEVAEGDLHEGDRVVVDVAEAGASHSSPGTSGFRRMF